MKFFGLDKEKIIFNKKKTQPKIKSPFFIEALNFFNTKKFKKQFLNFILHSSSTNPYMANQNVSLKEDYMLLLYFYILLPYFYLPNQVQS